MTFVSGKKKKKKDLIQSPQWPEVDILILILDKRAEVQKVQAARKWSDWCLGPGIWI